MLRKAVTPKDLITIWSLGKWPNRSLSLLIISESWCQQWLQTSIRQDWTGWKSSVRSRIKKNKKIGAASYSKEGTPCFVQSPARGAWRRLPPVAAGSPGGAWPLSPPGAGLGCWEGARQVFNGVIIFDRAFCVGHESVFCVLSPAPNLSPWRGKGCPSGGSSCSWKLDKMERKGKSLKQFAHCKIKAYLLVTTVFEFGQLL